jgi:UDP-3-O-[3-hydroxymyristoyl] glucosamine N-acyltransferase
MINLHEIVSFLNLKNVVGSTDKKISGAVQLDVNNDRDDVLMWVSEKFFNELGKIKKGTIICSTVPHEIHTDCTYILTENPRLTFQKVLTEYFMHKKPQGISATAVISSSVEIGLNSFIGNNVVVEDNCVIGSNVIIDHNTVIKSDTIIGNNVMIGANNVIGGVGFGYEKDEAGQYVFIPHIGNVVIGNNVEIGNNTCIDRAVLGSTVLMDNVKVDNLVHIAHGVKIGQNSLIIANAMVAGSVEIGENTWIAPSSSILNQKKIGSNVIIGLGAVVLKDVADDATVIGNPADLILEVIRKRKILEEKLFR